MRRYNNIYESIRILEVWRTSDPCLYRCVLETLKILSEIFLKSLFIGRLGSKVQTSTIMTTCVLQTIQIMLYNKHWTDYTLKAKIFFRHFSDILQYRWSSCYFSRIDVIARCSVFPVGQFQNAFHLYGYYCERTTTAVRSRLRSSSG